MAGNLIIALTTPYAEAYFQLVGTIDVRRALSAQARDRADADPAEDLSSGKGQ